MTKQPLTQFIDHLATLDAESIDAVKIRHLLQKFLAYKGIEGSSYKFYVPYSHGKVIGDSGTTIGTGVDFGQVSQSELKTTFGPFFKKYPSFKPVFESYAGLKGTEALTALQHRKTIVADDKQRVTPVERLKSDENYLGLNRAQTREMNALKMKQLIGKVVRRYNRAVCDDTGDVPKVEFKALPVAARIALLSFAWQHGPYFGGRHKDKGTVKHQYWQAFVCQDWQKAYDISRENPMERGPLDKTRGPRRYYETLLLKKLLSKGSSHSSIVVDKQP